MTKTFKLNENGKIEFTKEELSVLLDEVWNDGYNSNTNYVWESPYKWTPWWERPYFYDPIPTTTPYATWTNADALSPDTLTPSDTYTVSTQNSSSSGNSNCTSGDFVGDDGNNWTKTFGRTVDKVTPTNE